MDVQNVIRAPLCNPTGFAVAAVGVGVSALGAYYQTRYANYGDFGYTRLWSMLSPCGDRRQEMAFERKLFVKNLPQAWTLLKEVQQEAKTICGNNAKVTIEAPYGDLAYRCKVFDSENNLEKILEEQAFKTVKVGQNCLHGKAYDDDKTDFCCSVLRAYYVDSAFKDAPLALRRSHRHMDMNELKLDMIAYGDLEVNSGQSPPYYFL